MRKSKEIKRKKETAGVEYKKGNRADAYKMWKEAKAELDTLRGRDVPAKPAQPAAAPEAPPAQ
jgi:hypothetical protein